MAVLFLCTGNSCRSQMAEGLFRALGREVEVYSAGTAPSSVHPKAIEVMKEIGIDISAHRSKGIDEVPARAIDTVVTLCAEAGACPLPAIDAARLHWPVDDPAAAAGTEEEVRAAFRRARDAIRAGVLDLVRPRGAEGGL